jgi:hypothetical protein
VKLAGTHQQCTMSVSLGIRRRRVNSSGVLASLTHYRTVRPPPASCRPRLVSTHAEEGGVCSHLLPENQLLTVRLGRFSAVDPPSRTSLPK